MNENTIDFKEIRIHEGSQRNAFEELICQLAESSRPKNAKDFIRKEGSGGDAGVECFWRLEDGSEHAWQAKYFVDQLEKKQWNQISKSVTTALEKHPKLKKYYICLPLNRTHQKQNKKKSQLDKWNKKVEEWKGIAKNRAIEFEFWGKSEILSMLIKNSDLSGLISYWFNFPVLTIQHLKDIAEKSQQSLGDRFSPEFNVELPIAKSFDGIGLTSNWHKRFDSIVKEWFEVLQNFRNIFNEKNVHLKKEKWNPIKDVVSNLELLLEKIANENSLFENIDKLQKIMNDLKKNIKLNFNHEETEVIKDFKYYFNKFNQATNKLSDFLCGKDMLAFSKKSMLLLGDAGAGKSHLLCDITLNRLKDKLPTLFLLGQHYEGGNPLKFISDSLDLQNQPYKKVLEVLNALGEAYSTRTLIIIDAINEGSNNKDWKDHIIKLISELQRYPHIAFVFSCRSTFFQYLLPPQFVKEPNEQQNKSNLIVKIEHTGFSNIDDIYRYIEKQGILIPNTPILEPEFSTPLFLKIYCRAFKSKGGKQFLRGSQSIEKIFDLYMDSISETINKNQQYRKGEKIVSKALKSFALQLFPNNLFGLQIDQARKIIKKEEPNSNTGNLFNELINEGVLFKDIIPIRHKILDFSIDKKVQNNEEEYEYRKESVVRFTYERFSDYFIAKNLIEQEIYKKPKRLRKFINQIKSFFHRILSKEYCLDSENAKLYFRKDSILGDMFFSNKYIGLSGIKEILFIKIADKFKVELYDIIEIQNKEYMLEEFLKQSFLWRSSNSFTKRTFELLSQIKSIHFFSHALQVLLKLSIKSNHPWNADRLHRLLVDKTLAKRDRFWSTHVFFSYHYGEDLTIKNLIDWPYSADLSNLQLETTRLYAITLLWFTSASHRKIRDKATKSAIIILSEHPKLILTLIDQFSEVNDLYVRERLYAIAYGVIVHTEDKKLIKEIAEKTYEKVFKTGKPVPHILLRNYARSILEFAYNQKLLSGIDTEKFRPSYKSDWPIENPKASEISVLKENQDYGSIYYSLMGFSGDFGIYTMNCVHSFSPTPLTKENPETGTELKRKFINELEESKKKLFSEYINLSRKEIDFFSEISKTEKIKLKALKEKIEEVFNEEEKEKKRWLFNDRFMGDRPASFSRKWAQRWVCKEVYEMGWREELFKEFDADQVFSLRYRGTGSIERIGKKYQWIAFHKLLARLTDNVHYIDRFDGENKYERPSQLLIPDIDPTCYLRKTNNDHLSKNVTNCWWRPYTFEFSKNNIKEQEEWLKLKNIEIPFENLFQVKDPIDNSSWTVLHSSGFQKKELIPNKKKGFYDPGHWFRINAMIVYKKDLGFLCEILKNKNIRNQDIAEGERVTGFLKEYPFYYKEYNDWKEILLVNDIELPIKNLCPFARYEWEFGNTDYSIDETISFYLPSKTLIDKLDLYYPPRQFEHWVNKDNIPIFKDPSIVSKGPSCPLMKTDILNSWLNKDNLCLVWLIAGEKRLYGKDGMPLKRHDFNGVYFFDNNQITGDIWFLDMLEWKK